MVKIGKSNSQSLGRRRDTSAFGVNLDSSLKSRPLQTKLTSHGRLRYGMIICYKINRYVTGQCSAYHKMEVLILFGQQTQAIRPRSEMVRRQSKTGENFGENMGGAV